MMRRNLMILGLYWLIASSSSIWVTCALGEFNMLNTVENIAWILLALIVMILTINFLREYPIAVVFLPLFIPIIALVRIIYVSNMIHLRSAFCAISTVLFILVFNSVLYFEKIETSSKKHIELVHHRYLEYLRSFIWLVIFGVVGYLTWELTWELNVQTRFQEFFKELPSTSQFPLIIGLLNLTSVFIAGIGIVCYAFHIKLKEIEQIAREKE